MDWVLSSWVVLERVCTDAEREDSLYTFVPAAILYALAWGPWASQPSSAAQSWSLSTPTDLTTAAWQCWGLSHQGKYSSLTWSLLASHLLLPDGVISLTAWPLCPPSQIFPRSPVTIVEQIHPISVISINLHKSYFFGGRTHILLTISKWYYSK